MVYENQAEMDLVIGKLDDNSFIKNQEKNFIEYQAQVLNLVKIWNLS
jgi:hypothetical protein